MSLDERRVNSAGQLNSKEQGNGKEVSRRGFQLVLESRWSDQAESEQPILVPPEESPRVDESKLQLHSSRRSSLSQSVKITSQSSDTEIAIPDMIRKMHQLYVPGDVSIQHRSINFYRQGKFMEEYEDDAPWEGDIQRFLPTYHDLTLKELRGYFTWRKEIRRGNYQKISQSLAYIYIYEILNGIGTDSVQDRLRKLQEFEEGYLGAGFGDAAMGMALRRWMLGIAVFHNLSPEEIRGLMRGELLRMDEALCDLRHADERTDEQVFSALCFLASRTVESSVVLKSDREAAIHLFAEIWRQALRQYDKDGMDLFQACFGKQKEYHWYPLGSAIYDHSRDPEPERCVLNECREFFFQRGAWYEKSYPDMFFNKKRLNGLLHESDRKLRQYLKAGHPLKARVDELWADEYIDAVLEADRIARIEASRPKITIHFDELEGIRRDASETRDSLLIEEATGAPSAAPTPEVAAALGNAAGAPIAAPGNTAGAPTAAPAPAAAPGNATGAAAASSPMPEVAAPSPILEDAPAPASDLPMDPFHIQLLRMLLEDQPVGQIIAAEHGMPEVIADTINEALFDEIGDTAVECDGLNITLLEDYREDIARILGGTE